MSELPSGETGAIRYSNVGAKADLSRVKLQVTARHCCPLLGRIVVSASLLE